jgi:excisionase family DNA binding protein
MASESDEILTIDDLSEYLKVSKSTLYKLAQEGILPGSKVGKHWRFHKDTVVEWLKSHPEHGVRPDSLDADMREDVRE